MKLAWGGKQHILALITTLALTVKPKAQPVQIKAPIAIEELQPKHEKLPNFDIEVLEPLRATQKAEADKQAAEAAEAARQAEEARQAALAAAPKPVYKPNYVQPISYGGLIGRLGYISPLTNCVDLARQYGKVQPGNPISWSVTTRTPFIGAGVLFYFNHVAIVTGYGDGFVEVAHANCPGCPTRYSLSQIRGFF